MQWLLQGCKTIVLLFPYQFGFRCNSEIDAFYHLIILMSVCDDFPSDMCFVFLFFLTPSPAQATYKTSDRCYSEGWIEPSYPDAFLSIPRFYSWTSSFVRIEPLWKDLTCGQKKMITVHYILNTEGYKGINTINFYYMVSVRLLHGLLHGLFDWTAF